MTREKQSSPSSRSDSETRSTAPASTNNSVESKCVISPPNSRDIRNLILFTFCLRSLTVLIAFLSSYLPQFDTSPSLLTKGYSIPARFANVALRWDAIHYLQIAQEGYQYEHQYAFMPGLPVLLRILSSLGTSLSSSFLISSSICHFILSTLVSVDTTRLLYLLTLHHTESRQLALLSAYLSLLPSSPSTLHLALYTEPWYTWASYRGMLYCAQHQWHKAAFLFLFAGCFRSNAFMLGGFIFWGMIIDRWLDRKRIQPLKFIWAFILSMFPVIPFLFHQYNGYRVFCINTSHHRPWCTGRFPFIYTYVQSVYWNSGFLLYWTRQQLPNFVISTPVVLLLIWSSITIIPNVSTTVLLERMVQTKFSRHAPSTPFHTKAILPHAIYALLFTLMLLFFAHTQIILRQACSVPFVYWSAARLLSKKSPWGRRWVIWSLLWGTTSIVLWSVFLPPA